MTVVCSMAIALVKINDILMRKEGDLELISKICEAITSSLIKEVERNMNSICAFWHYQPYVSDKLKFMLEKKKKEEN